MIGQRQWLIHLGSNGHRKRLKKNSAATTPTISSAWRVVRAEWLSSVSAVSIEKFVEHTTEAYVSTVLPVTMPPRSDLVIATNSIFLNSVIWNDFLKYIKWTIPTGFTSNTDFYSPMSCWMNIRFSPNSGIGSFMAVSQLGVAWGKVALLFAYVTHWVISEIRPSCFDRLVLFFMNTNVLMFLVGLNWEHV